MPKAEIDWQSTARHETATCLLKLSIRLLGQRGGGGKKDQKFPKGKLARGKRKLNWRSHDQGEDLASNAEQGLRMT